MNIPKIPKAFVLKRFFSKTKPNISNELTVNIKDLDEDCEVVTIDKIGITELGQGALLLKTQDGKEFPMSAFSAETAKSISDFQQGKLDELPTIYNMVEQICENAEFLLIKVRIFISGQALRANLYFTGKKDLVLRNFRASDAIALATFYSIPILMKKELLQQSPKINSK